MRKSRAIGQVTLWLLAPATLDGQGVDGTLFDLARQALRAQRVA